MEQLSGNALVVVLALLGALVGGAWGHWRRGRAGIVAPAIIGAVLLPVAALMWAAHALLIGIGILVAALALVLGGGFLG